MANIVVTTTTNSIKVSFNDYSTVATFTNGTWNKNSIRNIKLKADYIEVVLAGDEAWRVSHNGASDSLVIDTVDGVAPTDLADLYTKLIALVA